MTGRSNSLLALTALAIASTTCSFAQAATKFVNLTGRPIYLAKSDWHPYQSQLPSGLAAESPAGWSFGGWYVVRPGEALDMPSGHLYVESQQGKRLSWGGPSYQGVVRNGPRFRVFVRRKNQDQDFRDLRRQGFKSVPFERFRDQTYLTQATAYRLEKRTFNFNFSSRDPKSHHRWFQVPGRVVDFNHNGNSRFAHITWSNLGDKVGLHVLTQGRQTQLFGPREKGYFRGTVTVHYTVRK